MKVLARSGDTLSYYSRLFSIPLCIILDSNRHVNPAELNVASEIRIPGYTEVPYTIQNGDTLWKIASVQNLSLDALLLLNQKANPHKLISGEQIFLPMKIVSSCLETNAGCDYKKLVEKMDTLKEMYPFITIHEIGRSVLGKPIHEIRVGKGKKKVHMNASFHANEWITTIILMSLLNSYLLLLTNGGTIRECNPMTWYEKVDLSIVPMVNPDGVDLVLNGPQENLRKKLVKINHGSSEFVHWKANIRGIDLNKQYPANWEIDKNRKAPKLPSPRDYPGSAPLTEPEAIAMADLARKNQFGYCLAFHTQGEEFYWGYEGHEPTESALIAEKFEKSSGYKAVQYIDSHGGYKDWFIQEFQRPGFTIEFGRGINPLPLSQFRNIIKKAQAIFFTALSL